MKIKEVITESISRTMYHVTPFENVRSILKHGLVPKIGDRSGKLESSTGIYLFSTMNDVENAMMNWLGNEFDEDQRLALLAIDTNGITGKRTPGAEYEFVVTEPISPQNIKLINADI